MTGITDLGADAARDSGSNGSSDGYESDYERFPTSEIDGWGKQHPVTAVRGTAVALRKLWDDDDPDRSDTAVILDDPDIVTSEAALDDSVVVLSDDEGDDFKVVNLDDDATRMPSDEMIDFDGNTFYGTVSEDFGDLSDGTIALKRGGGAGRRIASTLDVAGARAAEEQIERDEDGNITDITLDDGGFPQHNGGYIEYHPDGQDGEAPRQSRDPELRPDVEGKEVVIMIQRLDEVDPNYDGNAYWATVFANVDDDRMDELAEQYAEESEQEPDDFVTELGGTEFIRLDTTDEFEPSDDLLDDTGWIDFDGNRLDRSDADEVTALNAARVEADTGSIYVPEDMDVADVTPDGVEVETDPTEDELSSSDTITAFGAGSPDTDVEEAEA